MTPFTAFFQSVRSLLFRRSAKAEIDEEIRFHIEQHTAQLTAEGMAPDAAAREARRQFGNLQTIREECRENAGVSFGETMLRDVGFGIRMLRKNPGFTAVAVITLALGIGANTAIFSVVDRLLVRSLPVAVPERLALLAQPGGRGGRPDYDLNYPLYRDLQRENSVFSQLSAVAPKSVGLRVTEGTVRRGALLVSGNYFSMLGVNAALGRMFAQNEGAEIEDAAVGVLSHRLWMSQFGGDPQVLGRAIDVNGTPVMVIGVAPREFTGSTRGEEPDLYLPITILGRLDGSGERAGEPLRDRDYTWINVLGRLQDGVSLAQAEIAMRTLGQQIALVNPKNTPENLMVLPGSQGFNESTHGVREPLRLLSLVAGFILLLVCANLANMQLARAIGRSREFAIRMALGVQRGRIIRQLLTESLLLSGMGGCLGLLVAFWINRALRGLQVAEYPGMLEGGLDHRVLWFGFCASIFTGVVFGLAPAWRASRVPIVARLKNGGDVPRTGSGRWSLSDILVIVQIALAVIVLLSAGLCGRSLYQLQKLSPGFEPSRILLVTLDANLNRQDSERQSAFYDQLLDAVRMMPGAEAAALSSNTPLGGGLPGRGIQRIDGHELRPNERLFGDINSVSADYFRTLRIPLRRGREFDKSDTASSPRTVIVNEQFVQRYLPDQDPIGKRIALMTRDTEPALEIVGVVADTPNRSLTDSPRQTMFVPVTQNPAGNLTVILRTGLAPAAASSWIRETVRRTRPERGDSENAHDE